MVALPSFAQDANYCDSGTGVENTCGTDVGLDPIYLYPSNPYDPNPIYLYPSNPTIPDSPCWVGDYGCSAQDSSVDDGYGG